jgi:hypothetical protein
VLRLTVVHYFYMDSEEPKLKGLLKGRFGSNIFLFRLAGIPLRMKTMSTLYAVYMITVITCSCTTYVGMFADAYVHRGDLEHTMTTVRLLFPVIHMLWIHFYFT